MATPQTAKLTVIEGAQIIAELAPIAIDLALKLQVLFTNMNVNTTVTDVSGQSIQADQATIDLVNKWATDHKITL